MKEGLDLRGTVTTVPGGQDSLLRERHAVTRSQSLA